MSGKQERIPCPRCGKQSPPDAVRCVKCRYLLFRNRAPRPWDLRRVRALEEQAMEEGEKDGK